MVQATILYKVAAEQSESYPYRSATISRTRGSSPHILLSPYMAWLQLESRSPPDVRLATTGNVWICTLKERESVYICISDGTWTEWTGMDGEQAQPCARNPVADH